MRNQTFPYGVYIGGVYIRKEIVLMSRGAYIREGSVYSRGAYIKDFTVFHSAYYTVCIIYLIYLKQNQFFIYGHVC